MSVKIKKIELPQSGRVICVSDIHGSLDEFQALLKKVGYGADDTLILLGDLWLKGRQPRETIEFIVKLAENPNVHALLGNCDWVRKKLSDEENAWADTLPHIIDAGDYVFVHAGLRPGSLDTQKLDFCVKNDAFLETSPPLDRWVVTGHWPTFNYTHGVPSCNPIVNREKRIIAIDGGMVVRHGGQLNAFIIENGEFSFESFDSMPTVNITAPQSEDGGFNITWLDRHVERVSEGAEFSLCRHIESGRELEIANDQLWDDGGHLAVSIGTDYQLPLNAGDTVSVVAEYSDRYLAKHGGTVGWVSKSVTK
ncbi:MAG: metallophosphoesterase [Oscillospiraceae bacterium]|jgi:protein phosphatase|nr:metallophosphoesterase [Oscillospiraceae bacterium]